MKTAIKRHDLLLDEHYKQFLSGLRELLKSAQLRAALAANTQLVKSYWELGNDLVEKQKSHKWGDHFLDQFSQDMRHAFPEM